MSIEEYIPNGEISKLTESFWYTNHSELIEIIPDGTFSIIISPSSFYINGDHKVMLPKGIYMTPILKEKIWLQTSSNIVIIRCKAFVLSGMNLSDFDFVNKFLWRSNNKTCQSHLLYLIKDQFDTSAMSTTLAGFLFETLKKNFVIDENLRSYVNYLLNHKGEVTINEMVEEFHVSRQSLHKVFTNKMGLSPKQLAQIWKMNSFVYNISEGDSLIGASIESGYYDQAHCINSFKRLNGVSPKVFFKEKRDFLAQNIYKRFNNSYDPRF